jgi:hypothetical protein
VIKDNDYALEKGVRLWSEKQDKIVHVIEDIGHVIGNEGVLVIIVGWAVFFATF